MIMAVVRIVPSKAFSSPAAERESRLTRRQVDDAHMLPVHAATRNTCAQRLGAGFLGGEALGVGRCALLAAVGGLALDFGEDAMREAVAEPLQRFLDAPYITHVLTDTDDHA